MASLRRSLLLLSTAALLAGCGTNLSLVRKGDEEMARGRHQEALADYTAARGVGPSPKEEGWKLDELSAAAREGVMLDAVAGLRRRLDEGDVRGVLADAAVLHQQMRGQPARGGHKALAGLLDEVLDAAWAPIEQHAQAGDREGAIAEGQQLVNLIPDHQRLASRLAQLRADAARFYTELAERARAQGRLGSQVFHGRMAAHYGASTTQLAADALARVQALQQPPRASLRLTGVACPDLSGPLRTHLPPGQDTRALADVVIEIERCPLRVRRFSAGAAEVVVDTTRAPKAPAGQGAERAASQASAKAPAPRAQAAKAQQPQAAKAQAATAQAAKAPDAKAPQAAGPRGEPPAASPLEVAGSPELPLPDDGAAPSPPARPAKAARSPETGLLEAALEFDATATVSFRGVRRTFPLHFDGAKTALSPAPFAREQAARGPEVAALHDEAARAAAASVNEQLGRFAARRDAVLAAADARAAAGDRDEAENLYLIAALWSPGTLSPADDILAQRYGLASPMVASMLGSGSFQGPQPGPLPAGFALPAAEPDREAQAQDRVRWEPKRSDGSWELFGAVLQPSDPSRSSSAMAGAGRSGQLLWRGLTADAKHDTDGLSLAVLYQGKLGVEAHRNIYGDVHGGLGLGLSRGVATILAVGGGGVDGLGGGERGYFALGSSFYGFYGARGLFQLAWPWDIEATFLRAHRRSSTQSDRVGEELRFALHAVRWLTTSERSVSLGLELTSYEHGRSVGGSVRMVF